MFTVERYSPKGWRIVDTFKSFRAARKDAMWLEDTGSIVRIVDMSR
jgi:hypothetical protein